MKSLTGQFGVAVFDNAPTSYGRDAVARAAFLANHRPDDLCGFNAQFNVPTREQQAEIVRAQEMRKDIALRHIATELSNTRHTIQSYRNAIGLPSGAPMYELEKRLADTRAEREKLEENITLLRGQYQIHEAQVDEETTTPTIKIDPAFGAVVGDAIGIATAVLLPVGPIVSAFLGTAATKLVVKGIEEYNAFQTGQENVFCDIVEARDESRNKLTTAEAALSEATGRINLLNSFIASVPKLYKAEAVLQRVHDYIENLSLYKFGREDFEGLLLPLVESNGIKGILVPVDSDISIEACAKLENAMAPDYPMTLKNMEKAKRGMERANFGSMLRPQGFQIV